MKLRTKLFTNLALLASTSLPTIAHAFENGADVSWVDQEESSGYVFRNSSGTVTDCFTLLKNIGITCVRLRVWVNPAGGWCNGSDTLYKAQRAIAKGQKVMIDFHYSDTWADPGHQTVPSAWSSHTFSQLLGDVYSHTSGILSYLKSNGVTVTYVQVGNEINSGMLWPSGSTSNFNQLSQLINQGYNATKATFSGAKVIVHLANGYDNATYRWFFDNLKSNGGKWDITGMSHYPTTSNYNTLDSQLNTNMKDMISRYTKPVCICETGLPWDSPTQSSAMVTDVVNKVKALGSNGIGVFYWEPEAYPGWQGYTLGACNNSGQFTSALNSL